MVCTQRLRSVSGVKNRGRPSSDRRTPHARSPPSILPIDISQAGAVERIFEWCPDADILINNAGAIPPGDLLQIDKETWRKAWDIKIY